MLILQDFMTITIAFKRKRKAVQMPPQMRGLFFLKEEVSFMKHAPTRKLRLWVPRRGAGCVFGGGVRKRRKKTELDTKKGLKFAF